MRAREELAWSDGHNIRRSCRSTWERGPIQPCFVGRGPASYKREGSLAMFSWMSKDEARVKHGDIYEGGAEGLKGIYKQKLLPLEKEYQFHDFHSPALDDPDFDAKPMVMLVGQYSTGKTTFIRYLLEQDFPGIRIGPEPTTDRFIAVMHSDQDGVIPGNALVVDPKKTIPSTIKIWKCFSKQISVFFHQIRRLKR